MVDDDKPMLVELFNAGSRNSVKGYFTDGIKHSTTNANPEGCNQYKPCNAGEPAHGTIEHINHVLSSSLKSAGMKTMTPEQGASVLKAYGYAHITPAVAGEFLKGVTSSPNSETGKPITSVQVHSKMKEIADRHGEVPVHKLHDALGRPDISAFHGAIKELWQAGKLTVSEHEGRHGITDREQETALILPSSRSHGLGSRITSLTVLNSNPDQPRDEHGMWVSGTQLSQKEVIEHIVGTNPPEQIKTGKYSIEEWADTFLSKEPGGYTVSEVHPKSLHSIAPGVPENVAKYAKMDPTTAAPVVVDSNEKLQARFGGGKLDQAYGLQPHTVIDGKHRLAAAVLRGDSSIKAIIPNHKLDEVMRVSHSIELTEFAKKYAKDKGHSIDSISEGTHGPTVSATTKDGNKRTWGPTDLERIAKNTGHTFKFNTTKGN